VVLGLALSPSVARADKVLVFQQQVGDTTNLGGDLAGPNAAGFLRGLGHEVTLVASIGATLPADLNVFDTIWAIQVSQYSGVAETAFVDYVNQGGGLYISGERAPCCEGLNRSVQNIHNRLAPTITGFTTQPESGDDFVRATDTFGITTTPNDIPIFLGGEAGSIGSNLPLRNQVYKKASSTMSVMGAWVGEDLTAAGGCLIINMDLSFWFTSIHPEQDKGKLSQNLQRFLMTCNDRDRDGASDAGETTAGTNPDDPDSDDDGLCDGYGKVAGTCIPGESVKVDSDGDGLIDPKDTDDDNDTLPTSFEVTAELAKPKADNDTKPAWLDLDSDNDNRPDRVEGRGDFDHDGIPAIVDLGDEPENCDADEDCKVQGPTLICNQETGFCMDPSSSNPGDGGVSGAGGTASSGGAGGTSNAGAAGVGGSGGANSNGGTGGARPKESDSGCGCAIPGQASRPTSLLALLVLALLGSRRRVAHRQATWRDDHGRAARTSG
jgi:MYXO-CTERM domain-containing protein